MTMRDTKVDPRFGDIFVYRDSGIEFDALYLAPAPDGEFYGLELTERMSRPVGVFLSLAVKEWSLVEPVEGYAPIDYLATGGVLGLKQASYLLYGAHVKPFIKLPGVSV